MRRRRFGTYRTLATVAAVLSNVPQLDADLAAKGDRLSPGDELRAEAQVAEAVAKLKALQLATLAAMTEDQGRDLGPREPRHQMVRSTRRRGYFTL